MKKWSWVACLLLLPSLAWAQAPIEITPRVGWQYGGTQTYSNYYGYAPGDFHANSAMNYGGTVSFALREGYALELDYSYQKTDLLLRPNASPAIKLGDLSTHYIHVYGTRFVPVRPEKFDAIVMGGFGATAFSVPSFNARWLTSFGLGLGGRFYMGERLALRVQTRFLLPIQWSNSQFYFGSGGGTVTTGGSSTLIQGDASVGLTFMLGGGQY